MLRALQGTCAAAAWNLGVTLIGDYWQGPDQLRMIGRNEATIAFAVIFYPVLGGSLAEIGGWQWSFLPFLVAFAVAVSVAIFIPSARPKTRRSLREQLGDALPQIRTRRVAGALACNVGLFTLIFGLLVTATPLYLEERFRLSESTRGLVMALTAVTSAAGAMLVQRVHARLPLDKVVAGCFATFAAAFLAMGAFDSVIAFSVASLLYGAADGVLFPTLISTVTGSVPTSSRAAVVAVYLSSSRVGQVSGPLAMGLLAPVVGLNGVFMMGSMFAVSIAALAAIVFANQDVREMQTSGGEPFEPAVLES